MPTLPDPHPAYLFDTVVLSNFAFAGGMHLLLHRYQNRILITPQVFDEITEGILIACCRDESLTPEKADAMLSEMIKAGYYSPVTRISDLV